MGVGGIRLRRVGLSHNLLHMRSTLMEGVEDECEDDGTSKGQVLCRSNDFQIHLNSLIQVLLTAIFLTH